MRLQARQTLLQPQRAANPVRGAANPAAEIVDFEQATGEHQNHAQAGVAVTASLDDVIEEGRSIRRHLYAIISNTLRDDHALLAAWQSASHIERPGRKPKTQAPDVFGVLVRGRDIAVGQPLSDASRRAGCLAARERRSLPAGTVTSRIG